MAVTGNNSEGSSVPPEMALNLEMDDDYNKLTPSADYNSTAGCNIFRNKKFTKKRHESKARKTGFGQDRYHQLGSDEEYPGSPPLTTEVLNHKSIPKMMKSLNQTIKKMSIKDSSGLVSTVLSAAGDERAGGTVGNEGMNADIDANESKLYDRSTTICGDPACINQDCLFSETGSRMMSPGGRTGLEKLGTTGIEDVELETCSQVQVQRDGNKELVNRCIQDPVNQCNSNNSSSCNLQTHAQGKRRRHRRKQQYKRMAVDVQSDKKCLKKKNPTSNSSEDSGIGKRKRNLIPSDNNSRTVTTDAILRAASSGVGIVPVPVRSCCGTVPLHGQHSSINQDCAEQHQWKLDPDSDAIMMDCDDVEGSSDTRIPKSHSHITEEESGESDTQNDDIESLSDHNQDADDEESDYYNNDSSTTSLSESSFTILNSSKKFIPVHSREIRSGRRRLKNTTLSTIENEELSKFLQTPEESVLKVCPVSEKERQGFLNVASLYSLSYEECHDQDDQRMWVQFTKTPKTTSAQQRRNAEMIKAVASDRSTFSTFSDGSSLAPLFDSLAQDAGEKLGNGDEYIDDRDCSTAGSSVGIGMNLLVNSKRIKKGC